MAVEELHQRRYRAAAGLVARLRQAGHEAYLCGGSVRDLLLGALPKDYDIVTAALPDEVERIFPRTIPVGKQFGVIRVLEGPDEFEVATFRDDLEYRDGRRPEGVRFGSIEGDSQRRDFTINGMYFDPLTEQIVDLVGGQRDLRAGVIRTIGDPASRFGEDHLRLLRAVRFACQLGFRIDPPTWDAIRAQAELLERIARERVTAELERILSGPDPARGLRLLAESGLLASALPEVDAPAQAELALSRLARPAFELALAVLCLALDRAVAERMLDERLRLPARTRKRALALVDDLRRLHELPPGEVAQTKRILRGEQAAVLLELERAASVAGDGQLGRYHEWRLLRRRWQQEESLWPAPLLDGEQLIALGYPQGPLIGEILRAVEDFQLEGRLTDAGAARAWVAERFDPAGARRD